jgi:hypothetical protein
LKRGDKILMLLLGGMGTLFGGALLWKHISLPSVPSQALYALVKQEGEQTQRIDLTKVKTPHTLRLEDEEGHYNVLLLEPGRIRFMEANCPHGLCIASGWLSRPGEMALCLPHRVLVRIGEVLEEASVDAVSH